MSILPLEPVPELVRADYNVYRYTDTIYKIVRFRSTAPRVGLSDKKGCQHYDNKLDASLSRARRVVLELALCNPWDYFVTLTISPDKFDRFDLEAWYKRFSQCLRDQRKKGLDIAFLLVPERHTNGAWHCHGLIRGNLELVSFADERASGLSVPDDLVDGGYLDWPFYRDKFGWCSFAPVQNSVAVAYYVTKYLTKDNSRMVSAVGSHLYYSSHGLQRADLHTEIYGYCQPLDKFLVNHYDFCDTGMTSVSDGCDWTFALEYGLVEPLDIPNEDVLSFDDEIVAVDSFVGCEQLLLDGFGG